MMTPFLLGFVLGGIVGGTLGVVIMAAFHIASEGDRAYEAWQRARDERWPGRELTMTDAEWAKRNGISL